VQRSVRIVQEVSQAAQLWEQNPNEFERPDRALMAAAVDLLMKVVEGFAPNSGEVIAQMNFLSILPSALRDNSSEVKGNAFALMGSCSLNCFELLAPHLQECLPLSLSGLTINMPPHVSNNVSWALGEICVKAGSGFMDPYLDVLVPPLIVIIKRKEGIDYEPWQIRQQQQVMQNVCITLGRLGSVCGGKMGKFLEEFFGHWCYIMRQSMIGREKGNAFTGICRVIKECSQQRQQLPCQELFPAFVQAAVTVCQVPPDVLQGIGEILHFYKAAQGPRWPEIYRQFPPELKQRMSTMYSLTEQ